MKKFLNVIWATLIVAIANVADFIVDLGMTIGEAVSGLWVKSRVMTILFLFGVIPAFALLLFLGALLIYLISLAPGAVFITLGILVSIIGLVWGIVELTTY